MAGKRSYITTAIPYVNADPHVGFALEAVQADILARHRRARGDQVRFLSGTDDNSLKNVIAAREAGVPIADFVNAKARRFADLREHLSLSYDDFVRTSVDPRHRAGVERLWGECAARGDLYERDYEGLYCVGCEAFLSSDELASDGTCSEHRKPPQRVAERNWFFRLSRYEKALLDAIEGGRLRIEPEQRRNEALRFVRRGLADFSVSRSAQRAGGWGLPVPDDPGQVVSVWFDALANYVSALDYGTGGDLFRLWWEEADERIHVVGKGILRFHAVHWPAFLLSAGAAIPTAVFVHEYLTVEGAKLSKSADIPVDPELVASRFGRDALRWWFARDVPRAADADFREELVAVRANELADGLGNLVNRIIPLAAGREVADAREVPEEGRALLEAREGVSGAVDEALARFDLASAADAIWSVVVEANRFVATTRPWELQKLAASDEAAAAKLDDVLGLLLATIRDLTHELRPFLPDGAERIEHVLAGRDPELGRALFPKLKRDAAPY
jgi:methionyl-tRNA synthetase